MKRFKNILLVAGDKKESRAALQRATALAKSNQARLTVIDVMENLPRDLLMLISTMPPARLEKIAVAERLKQLDSLVAPIKKARVRVATQVRVGSPFLEIVRQVVRGKHDLVMKTAQGMGGIRKTALGTTDLHLTRKCPCPVWIIKPTHHKKYARILAAVDPDPVNKRRNELNSVILDLAVSLAQLEKSELDIVHAWRFPGESLVRAGNVTLSKKEADKLTREARKIQKESLNDLLSKYPLEKLNHQVHLVKGEAGEVISGLAQKKRVELIVMGTLSRSGIAGFFIGNTAEKVLSRVDCSVMTVKPTGFVTPVKLKG